MSIRLRSSLTIAILGLALACLSGVAVAAPEPFEQLSPEDGALLNSATPTLTWEATTAPNGLEAYVVLIDDEIAGEVDPAACAATCSFTPHAALTEEYHGWQIVAVEANDEMTESVGSGFAVDLTPPRLTWHPAMEWPFNALFRTTCVPLARATGWNSGYDFGNPMISYTLDGAPWAPGCSLAQGRHTLAASASDEAGNRTTITREFRTDTIWPALKIVGALRGPAKGQGTFEAVVEPGTARAPVLYLTSEAHRDRRSTFTATYPSVTGATKSLSVTAFDADGDQTMVTVTLTAGGPVPPRGSVGVRVDRGARYVNRRRVQLSLVWPPGATSFSVRAQPGGALRSSPVMKTLDWTLTGTGRTKAPSIVRVQYDWPDPNAGYEARVVLDLERPRVASATRIGRRLRLVARDKVSGLASVQLAVRRSHPAKSVRYRSTIVASTARWVRVRDRAGNLSPWRRISRG